MTSLKEPRTFDPYSETFSSKVYVRSTRNGKVQKIVRELYLRQDIPCSSRLCAACLELAPKNSSNYQSPFILSASPSGTKAYPLGHYLVPDTNALLNAIDLFETTSAFYDVIILQTVLEEIRNRSLPLYNRLIGLTKSEEKRFYVFFNEFRLETYIRREEGETINDRNDRAIRTAVKWYADHLKQTVTGMAKIPSIVMLSDDKESLIKAKRQQIDATSLKDYIKGLENSEQLLDMLSNQEGTDFKTINSSQNIYKEYISHSKMVSGIKNGSLHQGMFNVSPYNYLEGSIHTPAFDRSLIILGRENINRAIQGDNVVVELLPKDQWKQSSTKIIEDGNINKNENADAEEGESVVTERERIALYEEVKCLHRLTSESRLQPTARVVGILKRNWRQYVGHVDETSVSQSIRQARKQQTVFLIPMDKRIPKIRIRTRQAGEIIGKRILVTIDKWDRDSRYPVGHFVRSLGGIETKGAETEALLLEYDVQYRPFAKTVLDCLPIEGHNWVVPANKDDPGWKNRRDLRDLGICSIDPIGCQDIDDALHARPLPNGNVEVGVHIADVSHFVKSRTAMDAEASTRGTTVYLVDKRIDMLPMLLGTDLCSLKPHVQRYAFSVIWEISPECEIIKTEFTKSVIQSREAFTYEDAQARIDDRQQQDELTISMRILLFLSKKLKLKRIDAGALSLSSPEVRVQTESETSDPIDIKTKKYLDTMSLVEEFMLLANISVATKIYQEFPQVALLRRHGTPPESNFEELANQLKVMRGLELRTSSSKELANSLDACIDPQEPFFNTLIRILATRCMLSAEYFCASTKAYSEFRHYGLASQIYSHFTSPIRRYADLVVHRQLAAVINYEVLDSAAHSKVQLESICKNLNVRHRNAQQAGRASIEYYVGQALKGQVLEEEGFVMKIFSNGFVVFVPKFGIESLVHLKDLADVEPKSIFDAENYTLKTSGSRILEIGLFFKVVVRIADYKEEGTGKRKVRLELIRVVPR